MEKTKKINEAYQNLVKITETRLNVPGVAGDASVR